MARDIDAPSTDAICSNCGRTAEEVGGANGVPFCSAAFHVFPPSTDAFEAWWKSQWKEHEWWAAQGYPVHEKPLRAAWQAALRTAEERIAALEGERGRLDAVLHLADGRRLVLDREVVFIPGQQILAIHPNRLTGECRYESCKRSNGKQEHALAEGGTDGA